MYIMKEQGVEALPTPLSESASRWKQHIVFSVMPGSRKPSGNGRSVMVVNEAR